MGDKVRVFVVDDSAVVRRIITEIINAETDLEVVGAAGSGERALEKLDEIGADVVTLDVEMPGMSGLDVVTELRKRNPAPAVIMFSASTQRAAATTLEALARGASDYVAKPTGGSAAESIELIRAQMLPKIRVLGRRPLLPTRPPAPLREGPLFPRAARETAPPPSPPSSWPALGAQVAEPLASPLRLARGRAMRLPCELLCIGSSTGGPNALATLLSALPRDLGVPILIVQHMPPLFTKMLADRLSATTPFPTTEVTDGQTLEPGRAYLAPGDFHVQVARAGTKTILQTNQNPPENSCRPAVDVTFRSVAEVFGGRVLAVVLTGMGQDGLLGAERLQATGAQIVVQDEATSVVWGMPGFIAKAGLAEAVLPLSELPLEIIKRVRAGRRTSSSPGGGSL
ncbi:MAG: chemotaxis-specific protein-glutamate methyltransferase CheB [Myxococcota bacterium]